MNVVNIVGGKSRNPPRTVCKVCDRSIFEGDATDWVRAKTPGLGHAKCVESYLAQKTAGGRSE